MSGRRAQPRGRCGARARTAGACALGAMALLAHADARPEATPLDRYLDDLKTLRATFLQTLADAHGREIDRATGTLIVSRPGKFRWEIHPQPLSGAAPSGTGGSYASPEAIERSRPRFTPPTPATLY